MSSENFDMRDPITLKVIIRPSLDVFTLRDKSLSQLAIEKTLPLDPKTLIKDLCKKAMEKCNLEFFANDCQGAEHEERKRILWNRERKVPVLEICYKWYKLQGEPTWGAQEFHMCAEALNVLKKRSGSNKITSMNIYNWIGKRLCYERKQEKLMRQVDMRRNNNNL
uniref:Chromo domain-containing protein n=1 Tax=Strongyloides papillosus TaxID=174720 RepID=A0A0N5CBB1_STREA